MYKYDTHVHTGEVSACGKVNADWLVRSYKANGYTGIFITDHYYEHFFKRFPDLSWPEKMQLYLQGYKSARQTGQQIGLDVFLAIELKFLENNNDYLIYGVTEELLEDYPELNKHSLRSFRQFANQHDLLIYQAHPFRRGCEPANPALLDGIEVFNGHPRQANNNQSAKAYALKHKLNQLSGTDYHELYDLGRAGIRTNEKIASVQDFQRIIQTKNSFSLITSPENINKTFH